MEQEELFKTLQLKINDVNGALTSVNDLSVAKVC